MLDLALDGRVFLENQIDCALQEIDILLNTENTQLIGYPTFGTEFYTFLWNLSPTTTEIENYITNKIMTETYYASQLNIRVKAYYLDENYKSVYYVKIAIFDENGNVAGIREYQYQ